MHAPSHDNGFLADHARLLLDSHLRLLGRELVRPDGGHEAVARRLFEASVVVVSHDTAPDPVFNYGNAAALRLFEMDWETLTRLPSRQSAEPVNRADRERLMARVREHGFVDDYAGIRVSATGRRFHIRQATVWNLAGPDGVLAGQAAAFSEWAYV